MTSTPSPKRPALKRSTKIVLGTVLAAAALFGTASLAVQADYRGGHEGRHGGTMGPGRAEMLFEKFDTNHDGKITKAEIAAVEKDSLAKYDADKNGALSIGEFQGLFDEIMHQRMVRMFQHLDRDGDGKITEAELAQPMDNMMARMDRDGKGEISKSDMQKPRWFHHRGDDDDRGEHRGRMMDR